VLSRIAALDQGRANVPEAKAGPTADVATLPRYLQLLWGVEAPGRRGPRPGRTIQELGVAGIRLADRDGLDAVSMKAVAAELGMTTMSLYRYVDTKDQLLEVMVDVAYGPPPEEAAGPWRPALERWARRLAAVCVEHPWLVAVPLSAPASTPNALAWTDAGLRAFAGTALPVQERLSSLLVVDGYVRAHVRMSVQFRLLGTEVPADPDGVQYAVGVGALLQGERYAALAEALPWLADDDGEPFYDAELSFGIGVVLDGIAARVAAAG
jgi:AcrR family transcriptional regulator